MRGTHETARVVLSAALVLGSAALPGCQSSAQRRVAAAPEPGLAGPIDAGTTVVEAPVKSAPAVTFVDRHPLFSKPRDYYDGSASKNKIVKSAKATVIGIPAGIYGELRQIVAGKPAATGY